MANNSKLDIYKIDLRPTKKETSRTFRDLFKSKFLIDESGISDSDLFKMLLENFIKTIDADDFIVDKKNSKAITSYGAETCVIPHSNKNVIEGVIQGGRFGQKREKSSLGLKTKKEKVGKNDVILDQFYFFIHIPLDFKTGVLMIQSYTQDHIRDSLIKFLRGFLRSSGFLSCRFESFYPEKIKKQFREKSSVKKVSFKTNYLSKELTNEAGFEGEEEFVLRIEAVSKRGSKLPINLIPKFISIFNKNKFGKQDSLISLENFETRVYIENEDSNKGAYYDLGKENKIKPTIYLENYIETDTEGIPNFTQLKDFCFEQLELVKSETRLDNEIIER